MLLLSIAAAQHDSVHSGPTGFKCFDVSMNKQAIEATPEQSQRELVTICMVCSREEVIDRGMHAEEDNDIRTARTIEKRDTTQVVLGLTSKSFHLTGRLTS